MSATEQVKLNLSNGAKVGLLKAVEALEQLEWLRSFSAKYEVSGETAVLLNRLGKIAIYLKWLLAERAFKTDTLTRETLITIIEVEGKIADAAAQEGYAR